MAWTEVQFPYASQLTATKMNQLQANFQALADADVGAPIFLEPAFDNSPVKQGNLSTSTASGSLSLGGAAGSYTLTGGIYSWWTASGSSTCTIANGNVSSGVIGVWSSGTFYVDERYIQSSPPYDLGDGEIPLFVFIKFNAKGNVLGLSVAKDPPWANNGPTNINPSRTDRLTGKKYRKVTLLNDVPMHEALKDKSIRSKFLAGDIMEEFREVELTLAYKNSDMAVVPHPFGLVSDKEFVGMLDPFGKTVNDALSIFNGSGAKDSRDFLLESVALPKTGGKFFVPPGVEALR